MTISSLHTRGFRCIDLSAFRYRLTKIGFAAGPKVSGAFEKRAPGHKSSTPVCLGVRKIVKKIMTERINRKLKCSMCFTSRNPPKLSTKGNQMWGYTIYSLIVHAKPYPKMAPCTCICACHEGKSCFSELLSPCSGDASGVYFTESTMEQNSQQ